MRNYASSFVLVILTISLSLSYSLSLSLVSLSLSLPLSLVSLPTETALRTDDVRLQHINLFSIFVAEDLKMEDLYLIFVCVFIILNKA